jgi:predicted Fe-Mo cluster-binding NifX family protein
MKIAVATDKGGLEDSISAVMGRCASFTLVTVEGEKITKTEIMKNDSTDARGGAGIAAAQQIVAMGADAIIAGNFGPNAFEVLKGAKVDAVQAQGNVGEMVIKYVRGELKPLDFASGPVFGGMGAGRGAGMGAGRGAGMGAGRGAGMGAGRGAGMGAGRGAGMGGRGRNRN